MKKSQLHNFLALTKVKLVLLFLIISISNITDIRAQDNLTLWKVDQVPTPGHSHDHGYYIACGGEYYVTYTAPRQVEQIIIVLKNSGTTTITLNPVNLQQPSNDFVLTTPPADLTLSPNEETHLVLTYTAPISYDEDSDAVLIINNCSLNLNVGSAAPAGICVITDSRDTNGDGTPNSITTRTYDASGNLLTDSQDTNGDGTPNSITTISK